MHLHYVCIIKHNAMVSPDNKRVSVTLPKKVVDKFQKDANKNKQSLSQRLAEIILSMFNNQ